MNEQIDREIDVREWLAYAKVDRQAAASLTADCHPPRAQGERLHIRMLRP
jgi:hypothetical protein